MKSSLAPVEAKPKSIYGQILDLALPMIMANLVHQIYNVTDIFFLGRYKSSVALAAAGISMQISWMLIYLFVGISVGAGIVTSHAFGAKDPLRLHQSVHTTITISLISGVILTIAGVLATPFLLSLINVPPEVFGEATAYLRVHYLSMFPFLLYSMSSGILRGVGDTKTSMYAIICSLIVKFTLVFFLIRVMGGGVTWAAFGTICAQITAASVVLAKLIRADGPHKLEPKKLKIHKPTLLRIINVGLPTGFQALLQYLANIYYMSQINLFGPDIMAGIIAYARIEGFIYMPIEGFSMAASTLTGHSIGAKDPQRVPMIMKKTCFMSINLSFLLSAVVIALGPTLVAIFNPTNVIAQNVGILFIFSVMPLYFMFSLTQNFGAVIRGTGEAKVPMIIILIFTCGARVIWVTLVSDNINLLCYTNPIAWGLTIIAFFVYYKKGNWLKKHMEDGQ
ncbi:MAG: MATE family efflux transporter [Deltaproteobacteria bacterium]|jgi:putative MATE family efflux protein|nr:MATE family efflux transporter [Deltaproteobacteria bacterium]